MKFFNNFLVAFVSTLLIVSAIFLFDKNNLLEIEIRDLIIISILVFFIQMCSIWVLFIFLKPFLNKGAQKDQELTALKTAEKYRREFFGNVSHELKTPIFNIQGYIETLIDGALYDKNVNKKYLKRTQKSVDRLIYIIDDLESIAQLESHELPLNITEWKLKNLIDEVLEQFEIKAKKKKIKLVHDAKSTNFLVVADKDKISQVLYNLISNSIKYGKNGGTTKVACHQSKNGCLVSIKDNGIGIAEKNINRLFERFYRVDKSRSREQGGTGLGLAIVKHILEAHNQNISVRSTVQKGTEFTFSIECKYCD